MIPKNWVSRELGDIAEFVNGRGFKPHEWSDSGLPIIRIQNLNGSGEFNYYSGSYDPKIEVNAGDLLFAWSGSRGTSFGPHFWHGGKAVLNYHTWKVVTTSKEIDKRFLYDALKLLTARIEDDAHGAAALVHTQKNRIVTYSIWLPPVPEQRKIAAILSTWDRAIELTEKLIAAKRQRKAALMQQLLTGKVRLPGFTEIWKSTRLKDATSFLKDGTHFSPASKDGPFRYVTSKNIRAARMSLSDCAFISEDEHRRIYSGCPVQFGDVLLTKDGASVGNACLNELTEEISLLSSVAAIRGKTGVLENTFLLQYFLSSSGQAAIAAEVAGQAITRVTLTAIGQFQIPLPSHDEQKAIAAILNTQDQEIALLTRKLDALRRQKKGLMQQLLTGKVRVRLDDLTEE